MVLGLIGLWMSVGIIPRFAAIFRDMLEDRPLSALSAFVINSRWVLAILDCACILTAAALVRFRSSSDYLYPIFFLLIAQLLVTVIALFLPLFGIIHSLSPTQ